MAKRPNLGIYGLEEGAEVRNSTIYLMKHTNPNSPNQERNENTNAGAI